MEMLISAREAAGRLGVSRALVYSWHAARKPPYSRIFVKVSRRLLVDVRRLAELVESLRAEQAEPDKAKILAFEGGPKDHAQPE